MGMTLAFNSWFIYSGCNKIATEHVIVWMDVIASWMFSEHCILVKHHKKIIHALFCGFSVNNLTFLLSLGIVIW